jgi:hypothetical protein
MIRFASGFRMSVVASLLLLVLTISTSVIGKAAQVRQRRGLDPQTQLLNNYRKYVDRYIRISGETWKYDDSTRSATHSFTLKNIAGVAYSGVELNINYLNADGKSLQILALKVPGTLGAYASKKFTNLKVQKVPKDCDQAVLTVSKAVINP